MHRASRDPRGVLARHDVSRPFLFEAHVHDAHADGRRLGPSLPDLMDGGTVTAPNVRIFSPSGEWIAENTGVAPDIEVELDPKSVVSGHDPQLEHSVTIALEQLKKKPTPESHRPAYPDYQHASSAARFRGRPRGAVIKGPTNHYPCAEISLRRPPITGYYSEVKACPAPIIHSSVTVNLFRLWEDSTSRCQTASSCVSVRMATSR